MNIKRYIFEFILNCQRNGDVLPSKAAINCVFSPLSDSVDLHLEKLEREGLLVLPSDEQESVVLLSKLPPRPLLKIRGAKLVDRKQSPNIERNERIGLDLPGIGISTPPGLYELDVEDNSMSDAGLQSGDIAFIKHDYVQRGDIVAVIIDGVSVLRRLIEINGIPLLLAENPLHPSLVLAVDIPIHGVLAAFVRTKQFRKTCNYVAYQKVNYLTGKQTDRLPDAPLKPCRSSSIKSKKSTGIRMVIPKKLKSARSRIKHNSSPNPLQQDARIMWPKPPSGFELNEEAMIEFGGSYSTTSDQESKYGSILDRAIKHYEDKQGLKSKNR